MSRKRARGVEVRVGLDEIAEHFESLEDPRSDINQRHPFVSVMTIAVLAVLAGAGGPTAVARWAALKEGFLKDVLLWLIRHTQRFPKNLRHSYTLKLEWMAFEFQEAILMANGVRGQARSTWLATADGKLVCLRALLRLA